MKIVRSSWIIALFMTAVGAAMVTERIMTRDGLLVVGCAVMAVGLSYFVNKVEASADLVRIKTPLRDALVESPQQDRSSRRHVVDGQSGARHPLPPGIWREDLAEFLDLKVSDSR